MAFSFLGKSAVLVTICFEVHIILSSAAPDNVSATASSPCEEGWEHHGEFCIIMEKQPVYWRQASSNCISMGGNLASIHSKEQNDLYLELSRIAGINNLWIGLSDHDSNRLFEWQDGTVFDYKYWADPTSICEYYHIRIDDDRCFSYCSHYGRVRFRRYFRNYRRYVEDYDDFCNCEIRCHYMQAFFSGDCVALSTLENGRWMGKHCSLSYGYMCQKKTATPVPSSTERNDSTVTATTIAVTQANDENATTITSTVMEVKTASTIIASTVVEDKTVAATTITITDVDVRTAPATLNAITNVEIKTVETTKITSTDGNKKTALATNLTVVDDKTAEYIFTSTNVKNKTAAATIEPSSDINNGKTAKYKVAKQDDNSSWFSVKTFIIILGTIIMFMALLGVLYYYKRPWLEKQKLKVTTVFLRTANRPSSSFVLNRNEKCDGSIDKFTTSYVPFRNKV